MAKVVAKPLLSTETIKKKATTRTTQTTPRTTENKTNEKPHITKNSVYRHPCYQELVMTLVQELCLQRSEQLKSCVHVDTQGVTNMLFALSNLNIFNEIVFSESSKELAKRLRGHPNEFNPKSMNQWARASGRVVAHREPRPRPSLAQEKQRKTIEKPRKN